MQPEELEQFREFVYPPYGTPLVEAYNRRFEAVFILLHPFIRVPEGLGWSATRGYPSDDEITTYGSPCTWTEVGRQTGLSSCARLNQVLLTATGSLSGDLSDCEGKERLRTFLQSNPIWMPAQGRFEPLLQRQLVRAFCMCRCEHVIHVPEFPDSNPVVSLSQARLAAGTVPFPPGGSLVAPDSSFLFTVDWDSFFTLFYGAREFLADAVRELKLEGFFATANTDHAWFNYSMGCATVTLSPEHWQSI